MANPSKAEVADEIERLANLTERSRTQFGYDLSPALNLSLLVRRNLPTIIAALRSEAGADMRERAAKLAEREALWHEPGQSPAAAAIAAAIRALPLQPEGDGA